AQSLDADHPSSTSRGDILDDAMVNPVKLFEPRFIEQHRKLGSIRAKLLRQIRYDASSMNRIGCEGHNQVFETRTNDLQRQLSVKILRREAEHARDARAIVDHPEKICSALSQQAIDACPILVGCHGDGLGAKLECPAACPLPAGRAMQCAGGANDRMACER